MGTGKNVENICFGMTDVQNKSYSMIYPIIIHCYLAEVVLEVEQVTIHGRVNTEWHFGIKALNKCNPFPVLSGAFYGEELSKMN